MFYLFIALFSIILDLIRCLLLFSPADIIMENIVLRQQIRNFKRENPRPHIKRFDRIFWVWVRCVWSEWKDALIVVKPETVLKWHRMGFRIYWKFISNQCKNRGRKKTDREIRNLILQMSKENPTWRAPRIHGGLLKLGFDVSERTVSRYLPKAEPDGEKIKKWMAFLNIHRKGIAAMAFFIIPTLFFKRLYCFFIIHHDKRKIFHFNITFHPTMGIEPVRTSFRSPWQNGVAERWIGSCRIELLNHVIVLNRTHLYRLLQEYVQYYNEDRTHYSLDKDPPSGRPVLKRNSDDDKVIALPRVGGLHHKYVWKESA